MVSHLKEHASAVTGLALFDDDVHCLSCSRDRSFLCWDLQVRGCPAAPRPSRPRPRPGAARAPDLVPHAADGRHQRHRALARPVGRAHGWTGVCRVVPPPPPPHTHTVSVPSRGGGGAQEKSITYWDLREENPVQVIAPAHQDEACCITVRTARGGRRWARA